MRLDKKTKSLTRETVLTSKRGGKTLTYVKRVPHTSKETHKHQKNPQLQNRHTSKSTHKLQKRLTNIKRDPHTSKETQVHKKRPTNIEKDPHT